MQSNLKKCPFCGGDVAIDTLNTSKGIPLAYRVQCLGCGVNSRWCSSDTAAKSAWGIRVPIPSEQKKYKPWQQLVYLLMGGHR
jgi:hypothetical protein